MELTVSGDPDSAINVLDALEGILQIRRQGSTVFVEHDDSLASADIIHACVENDVRLDEARRGTARLEEIFMHLTEGE